MPGMPARWAPPASCRTNWWPACSGSPRFCCSPFCRWRGWSGGCAGSIGAYVNWRRAGNCDTCYDKLMTSRHAKGGSARCSNRLSRTLAAAGLTLLLAGCAGLPEAYPPPANPFLTDAPPLASTTLAQPTKVGLVWVAPVGSAVPPQAAQRSLVDKIKSKFAVGKRLEIVGATMIAAPQGDMLAEIRNASAPFNVNQVLVVMPTGTQVISPAQLRYGRAARAAGIRRHRYFTLAPGSPGL